MRKSTIAIFIAEVLYKTIREQETNNELFEYLYHTIQVLDIKTEGLSNFHVYFLLQLTKYLGFFPINNYSELNCYFDLKEGRFFQIKPMHNSFIDREGSLFFSKILSFSENQHENVKIEYRVRIQLLEKIIEYYTLHNEGVSKIKSLDILKEVFH